MKKMALEDFVRLARSRMGTFEWRYEELHREETRQLEAVANDPVGFMDAFPRDFPIERLETEWWQELMTFLEPEMADGTVDAPNDPA